MPAAVRQLAGRDVDAVVAIWNRALTRDPTTTGRFLGLLGDPDLWPQDSGLLVATHGDRPIGFIRAIVRRMPNDQVGLEPNEGWIPVIAVDPDHQRKGVGTALLNAALAWLREHGRKHVWVCGSTGSAPGYVFPGVDQDAYPAALALFKKAGFRVHHEPICMSRDLYDWSAADYAAALGPMPADIRIQPLSPSTVPEFLAFMAEGFPGDWNLAARAKVRAGLLGEVLIALQGARVVGYCQWEGEHFGPFGVSPLMRNRKLGARLFIEAVERIRAADGRSAWFNWADDDAARFYARFGLKAMRRFAILDKEL